MERFLQFSRCLLAVEKQEYSRSYGRESSLSLVRVGSYWQYVRLGVPVTLAAALLSMAVLSLEYWLVSRGYPLHAPDKARRPPDSVIAVPKARISTPAVPFPLRRALAKVAVSIRTLMIAS